MLLVDGEDVLARHRARDRRVPGGLGAAWGTRHRLPVLLDERYHVFVFGEEEALVGV